ncbi:MAG TPA: hypothetical protein VHL14_08815, partial [Steroidobacteraceae bacterium]|nr:hypothetical protein [Steroidobacteraceae bacterium]
MGIFDSHLSRRHFINTSVAAGAAFSILKYSNNAWAAPSDDFVTKSATEIAKLIRSREVSAVDAV